MFSTDGSIQNLDRLGADKTDGTQRNIQNKKYTNHVLENYSSTFTSDKHINFALSNLTVNFKSTLGGLPGEAVDQENKLKPTYQHFENIQLHQRPFLTVPYLGKGPGNVDIESTLKQGDSIRDRKTTIMDKEFMDYSKYPLNEDLKSRFNDPSKSIEELAMDGWTRGGASTREVNVQRT
jgi:hypothetical protein